MTGDLVGVPDAVDYDFHSVTYLNKDAVVVYRRAGSLEYFPSNQWGDILLSERRVWRALRAMDGDGGTELLDLLRFRSRRPRSGIIGFGRAGRWGRGRGGEG